MAARVRGYLFFDLRSAIVAGAAVVDIPPRITRGKIVRNTHPAWRSRVAPEAFVRCGADRLLAVCSVRSTARGIGISSELAVVRFGGALPLATWRGGGRGLPLDDRAGMWMAWAWPKPSGRCKVTQFVGFLPPTAPLPSRR